MARACAERVNPTLARCLGDMLVGMDIDPFLEIVPSLIEVVFYVLCLGILVGLVFAILRTPREIKKNRAVLTKILSVLRSIDTTLLSERRRED